MSQFSQPSITEYESVKMEVNGHPYYIKSKKNIPHLYDIDTNEEVGYWSSKKGEYVMFSLYNRIMKQKYEDTKDKKEQSSDSSSSDDSQEKEQTESSESESDSESEPSNNSGDSSTNSSEETDSDDATDVTLEKTKNRMNSYSLVFLFIILFVYLTLQKEFQSIYFDFTFIILINLLNILNVFEMLNHNEI